MDAAEIANAGTPLICGIGVKNLLVEAADRNADAIVCQANDGSAIQNHDEKIFAIAGAADDTKGRCCRRRCNQSIRSQSIRNPPREGAVPRRGR